MNLDRPARKNQFDQTKSTLILDPQLRIRIPSVKWSQERFYWRDSCIYNMYDKEMNNVIEVSDEEQFAKGQNSRDLQVCSDVGDVETQIHGRDR